MLKESFCKSIVTLLILSCFCFGQTTGGGSIIGGGGVLGGGKADSLLKKEVTSVFDKRIFSGLGQKTTKSVSTVKTNTSKKSSTKSKNTSVKSPKAVAQRTTVTSNTNQTALNFKPIDNTGFDQELANILSQKADENAILLMIFRETKKALIVFS
jgi:hypothetical protein